MKKDSYFLEDWQCTIFRSPKLQQWSPVCIIRFGWVKVMIFFKTKTYTRGKLKTRIYNITYNYKVMRLIGHVWLSFSITCTRRLNFQLLGRSFLSMSCVFKYKRVVKLFKELGIKLLSKNTMVDRYIFNTCKQWFIIFFSERNKIMIISENVKNIKKQKEKM